MHPKICITFCLISIDPSIHRLDKPSLSHQTRMELLIDGISNRAVITDNSDDIAAWNGRLTQSPNGETEVTDISWGDSGLAGSLRTASANCRFTSKIACCLDLLISLISRYHSRIVLF